jgi:hypothetical protein
MIAPMPASASTLVTPFRPTSRSTVEDPVRTAEVERDALATLKQEVDIARRLLAVFETAASSSSALPGYVQRLSEILASSPDVTSATSPARLAFSTHLALARHALLEKETSYQAWVRFARVLVPTGSVAVPDRFVRPARPSIEDEPINLRVVDMALRLAGER